MDLPEKRNAYISGLRRLANALEAHPDLQLPDVGSTQYNKMYFWFWGDDAKKKIVEAAEALGLKKYKKDFSDDTFRVTAMLDGVHVDLIAYRKNVCTARVVGKKMVERTVSTASETRMVEVDDVVWECPPILAETEAAPA